jgi:hypothetical protein
MRKCELYIVHTFNEFLACYLYHKYSGTLNEFLACYLYHKYSGTLI